jgi:hypothetical protein
VKPRPFRAKAQHFLAWRNLLMGIPPKPRRRRPLKEGWFSELWRFSYRGVEYGDAPVDFAFKHQFRSLRFGGDE